MDTENHGASPGYGYGYGYGSGIGPDEHHRPVLVNGRPVTALVRVTTR
jgi:hypothetical protein